MNNNILLLPHSTGIAVIDINAIIRIEATSSYSKLFLIPQLLAEKPWWWQKY